MAETKTKTCRVAGCDRPFYSRHKGRPFCRLHYFRAYRGADVEAPVKDPNAPPLEPIAARVTASCVAEVARAAVAAKRSTYAQAAEILEAWAARKRAAKARKAVAR